MGSYSNPSRNRSRVVPNVAQPMPCWTTSPLKIYLEKCMTRPAFARIFFPMSSCCINVSGLSQAHTYLHGTAIPPSAWRKVPITCASVNLLFFINISSFNDTEKIPLPKSPQKWGDYQSTVGAHSKLDRVRRKVMRFFVSNCQFSF